MQVDSKPRNRATTFLFAAVTAVVCALALQACGGGGGGGEPPASPGAGADGDSGTSTPPPAAVAAPTLGYFGPRTATVTAGQPVTLSVEATAEAPLAYQWQRNGADIAGATQARYTHVADAADTGSEFRVRVSTAGGAVTSDAATLTVLPARSGTAALFAGAVGGPGNLDGVGAAARLAGPYGLAVDLGGNVIVADGSLRKVTPAGAVTTVDTQFSSADDVTVDSGGHAFVVTSYFNYPGYGGAYQVDPGTAAVAYLAGLGSPTAVVLDPSGNLVVADGSVISRITPDGVVTVFAGGDGSNSTGNRDGVGAAALFDHPRSLAVDAAGNVFVADTGNDSIRRITPAGAVSTLVPASAGLEGPNAIVLDGAGNLLVADAGNQVIRRITPDGSVSTLAGATGVAGNVDGPAANARFADLQALALDGHGDLYIADNHTLRRLDTSGNVTTVAGLAEPLAPVFGRYHATDAAGNVHIAQRDASAVGGAWALQKIGAGATTTLATGLSDPQGIALDGAGNVYVADRKQLCPEPYSCYQSGVLLRIGAADDRITALAGSLASDTRNDVDGSGAAASLIDPRGLAVDAAGNVYLGTTSALRRITPAGAVSTIRITDAGTSLVGSQVLDVAVDPHSGAIYALACNFHIGPPISSASEPQVVRVDAQQGSFTVLAGRGYGAGDGPGATASFGATLGYGCPSGIGTDPAGNVYLADTVNQTVRMIAPDGLVRTIAGRTGMQGIGFGPLPATLSAPTDVSVDAAGNLYIGSAHALVRVRFAD